ncbi:hypothetical protein FRC07_000293 [Ceratobasidium sp. 392]|nr:hypothetical protein FRC07_000293 [Ceratobasidium sp. 392]
MQSEIHSGSRVRTIVIVISELKCELVVLSIEHKKDPGIPSTLPFKEDILAEIEQGRRQAEEDKQRRKETKSQATLAPSDAPPSTAIPTTSVTQDDSDTPPILIDSSLPTLGAVIDSADAVLCAIDARDPQTFRSKHLEEVLAQKDKGLVFALTKTGNEVSAPVVPFRASDGFIPSMEKGKQKASLESMSKEGLLDAIVETTKSHAGAVRIAVVGLTNCGKSTLLNSLLSTPALPTYQPSLQQPKKATYANTTLGAQHVSLSHAGREFQFVDTPGMGYVQFNAQPKPDLERMDVDESEESGSEENEEMDLAEFEFEDEDDSEEEEEESSEEEPTPAPISALKSKRPLPTATRTPKKVSFAPKQSSKAKPAPAPRRIGNAKPGGTKAKVKSVAGEESYDFSKFF